MWCEFATEPAFPYVRDVTQATSCVGIGLTLTSIHAFCLKIDERTPKAPGRKEDIQETDPLAAAPPLRGHPHWVFHFA